MKCIVQVFTPQHELELEKYLKRASDIYFGLSTQDFRRLAFEYAQHHKLKMPAMWISNKSAGVDWQKAFLTRNPDLSIRKTQGSLSLKCFTLLT